MRMKNQIRKMIVMVLVVGILISTLESNVRANSDIAVNSQVAVSGYKIVSGEIPLTDIMTISKEVPYIENNIVSGEVPTSENPAITKEVPITKNIMVSGEAPNQDEAHGDVVLWEGTNKESSEAIYECAASKKNMEECVLDTLNEVEKDVLKNFSKYYSKKANVKRKSVYLLSTYNYNQRDLNIFYKKEYGAIINGSCSMVASTSAAEYYTRKGFAKTLNSSKYKNIFSSMVLIGFGTGAYNGESTQYSKLHQVIGTYYNSYGKSGYGKYVTTKVGDEITAYNKKQRPVVGHFQAPNKDAHAMLIVGYYDVTVNYKKTKDSKPESMTVRYYAVNDGWNNATSGEKRISYIRSDYLKNGITVLK